MVRLAKEEEVVPNEWYYIQDPLRRNVFLKQQFAPEVEWQTILDFLSLNKIYVRKEKEDSPQPCITPSLF